MTETKGHPHAQLALQYWAEAAKDAEAWRNWQIRPLSNVGYWVDCNRVPSFYDGYEYRRRPEPRTVTVRYWEDEGKRLCYWDNTWGPTMTQESVESQSYFVRWLCDPVEITLKEPQEP